MSSIHSLAGTVALALLVMAGSPGLTEAKRDFSNVQSGTTQGIDDLDTLTRAGRNIGGSARANDMLLIDDQFVFLLDQIKAAVAKLKSEPIRFVLNTHWHGSDTGGNENGGADGAVIIAHQNVRKRMRVEPFMEALGHEAPPAPVGASPVIPFPAYRNLKHDSSASPASAHPSEPRLGDPRGSRSRRWGRQMVSSSPRAAAMWAVELASASERRAAGHEEAAGGKALGDPDRRWTYTDPPRWPEIALDRSGVRFTASAPARFGAHTQRLLRPLGDLSSADLRIALVGLAGAEGQQPQQMGDCMSGMRGTGAMWIGAVFGCRPGGDIQVDTSSTPRLIETDEPTDTTTPVGLAIEVENGAGMALQLRQGQRFFINQVDIRSFVTTSVDQGIDAITESGDFASLDWSGLKLDESEPLLLPNPDGTFTNRSFYRGATWMNRQSFIRLWQVDANGQRTSPTLNLDVGTSSRLGTADSFFIRRMRGIQWALNCPAINDCTDATTFREEALVELRNSRRPNQNFELHPSTTAFRVQWTAHGVDREPYEIPVKQISDPDYDYGFNIELAVLTPPGPGGFYTPGTDIEFQLTLTDGSGTRLHPQGSLPSYADVVFGVEQSGIQYYRAFFDETATYWRRKHRERMLMAQIIGPNQAVQPIYSVAPLEVFLDPEDSEVVATPAVDGVYSESTLLPPANVIFLGAFTQDNPQWFEPNVDTFTFHIPEDAEPGTYKVTIKGRRVYLGEDIPRTTSIEIQVGTEVHTNPILATGPCNTCHSGGGDLGLILHANDDRSACAGCHVPLAFELEGPIATRVHFIHSRSGRFGESLAKCAACHLDELSIQRTSKHACMSCHTAYPDTHVDEFGAIKSIYIGGGPESFARCTDSCHTTHPGSGF